MIVKGRHPILAGGRIDCKEMVRVFHSSLRPMTSFQNIQTGHDSRKRSCTRRSARYGSANRRRYTESGYKSKMPKAVSPPAAGTSGKHCRNDEQRKDPIPGLFRQKGPKKSKKLLISPPIQGASGLSTSGFAAETVAVSTKI